MVKLPLAGAIELGRGIILIGSSCCAETANVRKSVRRRPTILDLIFLALEAVFNYEL
jgi:hypothetical protein